MWIWPTSLHILDVGKLRSGSSLTDGNIYLLMEIMDNGSLKDNLPSMSFEAKATALSDYVQGLMELHSHGILHLDPHEGNLLFDTASPARSAISASQRL
jgi:serine/threonine protein kinase